MATVKLYDLAIKTGEYERQGEKKNRYKNIGSVMQKDDGGRFLLLDATVLASSINYIANAERREQIIVSMFEAITKPEMSSKSLTSQYNDVPF